MLLIIIVRRNLLDFSTLHLLSNIDSKDFKYCKLVQSMTNFLDVISWCWLFLLHNTATFKIALPSRLVIVNPGICLNHRLYMYNAVRVQEYIYLRPLEESLRDHF